MITITIINMSILKDVADIPACYGITIIDSNNNILGFHTCISRIKNGISQIKIIIGFKKLWISGKAIRIDGIGIKFIGDYTLDNPNDTIDPCGFIYC